MSSTSNWQTLLIDSPESSAQLGKEKLHDIERSASNVIDVVLRGLSCIGKLQFSAYENKAWPPSPEIGQFMGEFHEYLAELVDELRSIEVNAMYNLHKLEMKGKQKAA